MKSKNDPVWVVHSIAERPIADYGLPPETARSASDYDSALSRAYIYVRRIEESEEGEEAVEKEWDEVYPGWRVRVGVDLKNIETGQFAYDVVSYQENPLEESLELEPINKPDAEPVRWKVLSIGGYPVKAHELADFDSSAVFYSREKAEAAAAECVRRISWSSWGDSRAEVDYVIGNSLGEKVGGALPVVFHWEIDAIWDGKNNWAEKFPAVAALIETKRWPSEYEATRRGVRGAVMLAIGELGYEGFDEVRYQVSRSDGCKPMRGTFSEAVIRRELEEVEEEVEP